MKKTKFFTSLLIISLVFMMGYGCQTDDPTTPASSVQTGATQYPLTLTTYYTTGQTVEQTYTQTPTKVITSGQTTIDFMVYFGLEDLIVGTTLPGTTSLPESYHNTIAGLPVLSESLPTQEHVIASGADFMFSEYGGMFVNDQLGTIKDINDRGQTIYTLKNLSNLVDSVSIEDVWQDYRNLGTIFNISDKVEAFIAEEQAKLDEIKKKAELEATKPSVMILTQWQYHQENDLYLNYGRCAIATSLIELAGGTPVTLGDTSYSVSKEAIIKANPDIILLNKKVNAESGTGSFVNNAELRSLSAIANNNVRMIDDSAGLDHPGLFLSVAAQEVAEAMYPEW